MHDSLQDFRSAILATLGHAPDVIEPGRTSRRYRQRRPDGRALQARASRLRACDNGTTKMTILLWR